MGSAYGNVTLAALTAGAKTVIACDMAEKHLALLVHEAEKQKTQENLISKKGYFPNEFNFENHSIAAIHASHILEYLNTKEVDRGLRYFYDWLQHDGKLFITCYTIHIAELANDVFQQQYQDNLKRGIKWPGYLEDFDKYSNSPTNGYTEKLSDSPFPTALHLYDLDPLVKELQNIGFIIEYGEYLDGKLNGAMTETWLDGREYIGIIACKS